MLAARDNDGLVGLSKKQALEKMIKTTNDIHTLARIITYFKLEMEFKISLKQIRINYNQFYYPEAKDFLIKHLKISIPEQYDDSLFIQNPDTSTSQEVDKNTSIPPKETIKTTENTTLTSQEESVDPSFQ